MCQCVSVNSDLRGTALEPNVSYDSVAPVTGRVCVVEATWTSRALSGVGRLVTLGSLSGHQCLTQVFSALSSLSKEGREPKENSKRNEENNRFES